MTPSVDTPSENNATNAALHHEQPREVPASAATTVATAAVTPSQSDRRPSQPINVNDSSSSVATTVNTISLHPRAAFCSLNPSTWSKRRIRIASCGCFVSAIVCTVRLLLDPGPSAYIIHSIIILIDMILIHVFTYTPWLSVAGEITAIIFATCFHLTNQTIFELLETTLIAVLVSFHMIQSRNDQMDRAEYLEQDMIGLKFYVEHHTTNENSNAAEMKENTNIARRPSSLSISDHRNPESSETGISCDNDVETGAFVPHSDMTHISSFSAKRSKAKGATASEERSTHWWHNFFDHFLDGSAGVMYTSFLGLIIDEIVNYGSSKY
jgi:hypothetical protein